MTSAAGFAELCPGCFTAKGNAGICAHCGYDESLKRGPLILAHRTLLHNGPVICSPFRQELANLPPLA